MQNNEEEWKKHYGELIERKIAHLKSVPKETRDALTQQWKDLIAEINQSQNEDPAGRRAQALLDRWLALHEQTTGVVGNELIAHLASPGFQAEADRFTKDLSEADRARARVAAQRLVGLKEARQLMARATAARRA